MCVQIDVGYNDINQAASLELIAAMKGKSMVSIGMASCKLGVKGAKAMAELVSVTASVTKILVGRNNLRDEGTIILCDALRESTVSKVEELSLYNNDIGPDGAKAIAALCAVCASITSLSLGDNDLCAEGEAVVRKAVEGRSGFELKL